MPHPPWRCPKAPFERGPRPQGRRPVAYRGDHAVRLAQPTPGPCDPIPARRGHPAAHHRGGGGPLRRTRDRRGRAGRDRRRVRPAQRVRDPVPLRIARRPHHRGRLPAAGCPGTGGRSPDGGDRPPAHRRTPGFAGGRGRRAVPADVVPDGDAPGSQLRTCRRAGPARAAGGGPDRTRRHWLAADHGAHRVPDARDAGTGPPRAARDRIHPADGDGREPGSGDRGRDPHHLDGEEFEANAVSMLVGLLSAPMRVTTK